MADFKFTSHDYHDEDSVGITTVKSEFSCDYLGTLAEKFYWFLKAVGFTYITSVTVQKEGGGSVGFGEHGEIEG